MTKTEQETIEKLYKTLAEIKYENNKFTSNVTNLIEAINKKVEQKHVPISLENDILQVVQYSIQKAIQESLIKYDSPLIKLITNVVNENSLELKKIISDSFNDVIQKNEFKQSIREGFSHKVARALISTNDSLFNKISNELKQDAVFKSKIALAVEKIVTECLNNKESN